MRTALAFYTVRCDRPGYPVQYVDPVTWRVRTFHGPFGDPGEASQEFQACVGGPDSCYLDPEHFRAKARAMAQRRSTDEYLLKTWHAAGTATGSTRGQA